MDMKIYCINEKCTKRPKGYAICTALMDAKDCPKGEGEDNESNEENSKSDSDISL